MTYVPEQERDEHGQRLEAVERRFVHRDGGEDARGELDEAEDDADLAVGQ
jgi:hypothetical protein